MARILTTGWEIPGYWEGFALHNGQHTGGTTWDTGAPRSGAYALRIQGSSTGGTPQRYHDLPVGLTELWVRFAFRMTDQGAQSFQDIFQLRSNTTDQLIRLRFGFGQPFQVLVGGTTRITSAYLGAQSVWTLIELHAVLGDAGLVELRINGKDEGSWSGDTKPGSDAYWSRITIGNFSYGGYNYYDDFAINDNSGGVDDSWCGDGHVVAMRPNAAGSTAQWTPLSGANYENVDEVTADGETSYVSTSNAGDIDLYNLSAPVLPAGAVIGRVWASVNARKVDANANDNVQIGIQAGATAAWSTDMALSTDYTWLSGPEYLVNPDNSAEWKESDLGSLQAGIKAT